MKDDASMINIAYSHRHRIEFEEGVATLWCECKIGDRVVKSGFKVAGLTEENWPANRTFLLLQTLPLMYKQGAEAIYFHKFTDPLHTVE